MLAIILQICFFLDNHQMKDAVLGVHDYLFIGGPPRTGINIIERNVHQMCLMCDN